MRIAMSKSLPKPLVEFFAESKVPLTLSDPNLPDDPLIFANAPFFQMVGFAPAEVFGKNCRFMQGADPQQAIRKTIRENFAAQRDTRVIIRNFRQNGESFDNFLYIFTINDLNNRPMYRIGSQFEVPRVNKTVPFEKHAAELRASIEKLNAQAAAARQQVINLADIVGLTVKDLLMARLQVLKAQTLQLVPFFWTVLGVA
jgi:hypothetical protein